MNRLAVAFVIAVVVSIIAGAWWLSTETEREPAQLEVVAPRVAVAPLSVPAPVAPVVQPAPEQIPAAPQPVDGGQLAEVEIEVVEGSQHLVGVSVELDGPGGRVSRPTDIMGFARFTLPVGSWQINKPARRNQMKVTSLGALSRRDAAREMYKLMATPLEIVAPATHLRLELPVIHHVKGRVLDRNQQPVAYAEVKWVPFEFMSSSGTKLTNTLGEFVVETAAETLEIQATHGSARSLVRSVSSNTEVTLVLEHWTQLDVEVTGPAGDRPRIQVLMNDEVVATGTDERPLAVPLGNLTVLARRNSRGKVLTGKAFFTTKEVKDNHVELKLSPSPPLKGRLINAAGVPVPGVSLEAREVDPTTISLHTDGGVPRPSGATAMLTNHLGEFSFSPPLEQVADPLYQVRVVGLWQARTNRCSCESMTRRSRSSSNRRGSEPTSGSRRLRQ